MGNFDVNFSIYLHKLWRKSWKNFNMENVVYMKNKRNHLLHATALSNQKWFNN